MTTLNAAISAVTVYTDRARVTRRGTVHLQAGEQQVEIGPVSPLVLEDSVRASGKGLEVKLLGVEVASVFVTEPPEANVADLRRELEALQDGDTALVDDDAAQQARAAFVEKLRESSGAGFAKAWAYGRADIDRVRTLAEHLDRELTDVQARRREIAIQRRERKREIEAVQARLNQVQNVKTNRRQEIRVTVEAAAETDLELEVTYTVRACSWSPLYDIRLDGGKVGVTYLASISQKSGEDWPPVELSLSTARPAVSTELPELDPWYIDVERPVLQHMQMDIARAAGLGMPAPAMAPAPMEQMIQAAPQAEFAESTVEASGAAVTYRVARPVAVPSDGAPHKTMVTTLDLAAQLDYVIAPKLAEEAYLRAKVKNTSPFILLPGSANIFHGPDFVGTTALETVAPNEEIEVHLGVDDRIKVERELVERSVDKTLIGNTRRLVFGYNITLTNLLATPAKITLMDQLPVARNEEIKVKAREISPKPTEQDDLHILKWEMELAPGQKREVLFGFTIEHPRALRLRGISD